MAGGKEHRGWGVDRHIAVNAYDLALTAAMGQGGKKPKPAQLHPRPGRKAKGRKLTDFMPNRPVPPPT